MVCYQVHSRFPIERLRYLHMYGIPRSNAPDVWEYNVQNVCHDQCIWGWSPATRAASVDTMRWSECAQAKQCRSRRSTTGSAPQRAEAAESLSSAFVQYHVGTEASSVTIVTGDHGVQTH